MWNNQSQTSASWSGNKKQENSLNVSTLTVDTINAKYGNITGISSSVVATGYLVLNNTVMTTIDNILYVNGTAITTPSTLSSISDWSYFPAINNVNLNGSTIKNALGISTTYLTAQTIKNTTLNSSNIYNTFFNGRNINISTITTNVANVSLVNANSIIAPTANITKINANSVVTSNISSQNIYNANTISTLKLNTKFISTTQISTNVLNAQYADIPFVKTSSIEFQTALGRDMAISSMLLNRSIYIPDEEDNDGGVFFANRTVDEIYGAVTTQDNRSTMIMASVNDLSLVAYNAMQISAASTIQMFGIRGIDIKTLRSETEATAITIDTDALGITAKVIVAIVPEITLDVSTIKTSAYMSTNIINGNSLLMSSINANTISTNVMTGIDLTMSNINTNTIFANTYLNLPPPDASSWALFSAVSTVHADLDVFNLPQYDIKDFKNINGNFLNAKVVYNPLFPTLPIGGTVNADISVNAPTGDFGVVVATNGFIDEIQADNITVGNIITNQADVNIYGKSLVPGDSALFVEGGVVLDGGTIHGTTIGCLPVAGVNTVRLDVLPTGIDIVTPTYITIDSLLFANLASGGAVSIAGGGATSVAAGGALSLAGGSYIEYDTDQNYFINTTAGNDYTDIYVGNIHGADQGTAPLRINENRGVEITDANITLRTNTYVEYSSNILYDPNVVVDYETEHYVSLLSNRNIIPTGTIPSWDSNIMYDIGNYASYSNTWYCFSTLNAEYNTVPPDSNLSNVWLPLSNITSVSDIWGSLPLVTNSKIEGDRFSYARLGAISTLQISSFQINTSVIYTTTIGHPNPLVPTPIAINNALDLQENNILNVNNISADNIIISNITTSNGSFDSINVSTITGNKIVLKTNDFTPAQTLYYNKSNTLIGAVSLSDSNEISYTGFDKLKISAMNNMLLQSYSNININSFSTIFTGNVYMSNLSLASDYGFNISQSNQIQHWNGTSFDYYIPQLSYTDLTNNTTAAVASDWAYYPAKKDLDMNGGSILNVAAINYLVLTAVNGYFSNVNVSKRLTFTSPSSDTASFSFSNFTYGNGGTTDVLYFRNSPFLDNLGIDANDKNTLLNVQATQYKDNSNFFCYLQFVDNEANVVINTSSNNFVTTYNVAAHWSKYNAIQTVNIASQNISNVNSIYLTSIYGFNLSQSNEIQHWNPDTAEYDYYIPQLSYTDLTNSNTAAVASDWSYYPCKNLTLDMAGNFIVNVGGLFIDTLVVGQSSDGYINAGIVFSQETGDEVFYQLSKPYVADPVLDPVGSEGIYIVERSTADGSAIQYGRIFDDTIYKPNIGTGATNVGVVGDLDMCNYSILNVGTIYTVNLGQPDSVTPTPINVNNAFNMGDNVISNVGQMYYGATRQPFIQYGNQSFASSGTQTVTLPVNYANSNYVITATYSQDPGASAKPIHIDTRTTSNFTISAQSGHAAFWTTFGNNN